MKRILLALIVLGTGGGVFLAAHQSTTRVQRESHAGRETWIAQTQKVTLAQSERVALAGRVQELKKALAQSQSAGENALWSALRTNHARHLTPELRERLLEELGFNWQSSGEWLVVSKSTLRYVGMNALKDSQMTDAACAVLAVTPDERQRLDAALTGVRDQFSAWATAHLQREGPSGETVARYTLPADPEFASGLTNELFSTMNATLGAERSELLAHYSADWLQIETGFLGAVTNTLTVLRQSRDGGEPKLHYKLTRQGSGNYGSMQEGPGQIMPQYFPPAFKKIFPGGWEEVAQREGFELPK